MLKKILQFILRILAGFVLKKYKPQIIAITGSVGKTSAKEAIYTVLKTQFSVRRNIKNYNNEIGVPLTILGLETGGSSLFLWLKNFFRALGLIFGKSDYPKVLILEMAADRPGDIKYLTNFVKPDISVITTIGPSHLEFFKKISNIKHEKENLIKILTKDKIAVLNWDDKRIRKMKTKARVLKFGFSEDAQVRAANGNKISFHGSTVPLRMKAIGRHQIYAALAGFAVGVCFNMNLVEISQALRDYDSPPHRGRIIKGIKNILIIDDTYNSAPASALAGLKMLKQMQSQRKIAVLGDMLELGAYTEKGHRRVGKKSAKVCDLLFTVGERARFIADEARKNGMSEENIFSVDKSEECGILVQEKIHEGDAILIKGSRALEMEKIVEEIKI